MPRVRRVSLIPTTPGGIHLRTADISADEIVIDDEVVIRSSVFREVSTGESEAERSTLMQEAKASKRTPKYVIRKSTDLKKIKNIDDRIDAILASPMIENRRRPLGSSRSLEANNNERTPLRVPSSQDLQAVSSRRMSTIVMSKFAPYLHSASFTEGENKYLCSTKLNRRKTTENFAIPTRPSRLSLGTPLHRNTLATPDLKDASALNGELVDLDRNEDVENVPPPSQRTPSQKPIPSTSQPQIVSEDLLMTTVNGEPRSVSEFRVLVNMEISRLSALKAAWEDVLEEEGTSIPEAALTHIRAAVGKCGLLIRNRLQTFFGLIDYTEASLRKQEQGDINELTSHQRSNINDLLGMWTNIAHQISDIDKSFDRLRRWRDVSKWAYSSPPATPAPPPKQQQKQGSTSRPPRLAWKSKGTLKRLIPPAPNTSGSKLRPPKILKRSNLTHIKAQMLAKKKALGAGGNVDEIVIFGGGKNEGLRTSVLRGKSSGTASTLVNEGESIPGSSRRRGRPRNSESIQIEEALRTKEHIYSSPPVYESSGHQIELLAAEQAPKAGENIVHEFSDGEEGDVIEESVEFQSPRSHGRPRKPNTLETSTIEPELVQGAGSLRSPKRGPGRPKKSIGTSSSSTMLREVDSNVFTESLSPVNVSSLTVEHGSAPEKAVESTKRRGRPRNSSSLTLRIEESIGLHSPKRGRPKKSVSIPESSMAQDLFEENSESQSPKRRTSKVQNADPEEGVENLQSPKLRGRSRKSSTVLESETAELNFGLQSSTLSNVFSNMTQRENAEFQSPKSDKVRQSAAAESFHNVNLELPEEDSELQSPKHGRPRKSIGLHSPGRGRPRKSSTGEVTNFEADEIPVQQSVVFEGISSHQNATARETEFVEEQQQLQLPKRGRPRKSVSGAPAVPETSLQVVDVDIDESVAIRRHGRPSRPSLFVPDSQVAVAEEVAATLQSPKPRGRPRQSMIIDDSFDQSAVVPTPRWGRPRRSVAVDDSTLAAKQTPKLASPRKSSVKAVENSMPVVELTKPRGRPRKSVADDLLVANRSVVKQTPKRGRPRKSVAVESAVQTPREAVGTTSVISSPKLGRARKSVTVVEATPSAVVESASRKRGRPSRPSEVIISANSDGGNFLIPDSLPRKRRRMDHSSILSMSHTSTVANTTNPFSPPPRPITGTPRPHMSKLMRTKIDSSLTQSVLRKQLMLATTCGGNNSGRSSTAATAGLSQPNSSKRPVGRPRKSVRFLGSPDPQSSSTKTCLPVTPHVRSSTGKP
ncbi:unnamed protein product [Hymenolepis diminuta]|uniref:Guanylate kinase-associated protein mars n=1 Tax=Hymenolepis diminuta TaxID=6216 RepID=A0A0R3S8C5_HYMDI|nr:unnamed protein product [Hymenolepis diminuta]